MTHNFKVTPKDIKLAERFCAAIDKCPFATSRTNCVLIGPMEEGPCKDCLVNNFKAGLITRAQPFCVLWQNFLSRGVPPRDWNKAIYHLFFGLGVIHSLNKEEVPPISAALVNEINTRATKSIAAFIDETKDDLKSLGSDWYERFYYIWQKSGSDDNIWFGNIVLLKVFLEAIALSSSQKIPDPKKSKEPIEPWKSEQEKHELFDTVLEFIKEEARKKKQGGK